MAIFTLATFDDFRASSYEPGRPGWLGFRDLALPLFPSQKFRCDHMRRRAGPVTDNRAGNFSHTNTPARIPGLSVTKHFQLRMADKSERGSTGILEAGHFSSRCPGLNFPYEQKTKSPLFSPNPTNFERKIPCSLVFS